MSWPISRVLFYVIIHLGFASPQTSSNLPRFNADNIIESLFSLAPSGVYKAIFVSKYPVRSYRTFSPLPLRRFTFCCTFRSNFHYSQELPGTLSFGARTFLWLTSAITRSARKGLYYFFLKKLYISFEFSVDTFEIIFEICLNVMKGLSSLNNISVFLESKICSFSVPSNKITYSPFSITFDKSDFCTTS